MRDIGTLAEKKAESEAIKKQMAEFEKKGGKVKIAEMGLCNKPHKSYNQSTF